MNIKFLGRGSAFNTKEGNTSAYYKDGYDMILIDCGCTVFSKIIEKNLLDDVHDLYIAITHSHPDHIGSLGDLIFYCYYAARIRVHILYSEVYCVDVVNKYLSSVGVPSYMFNFVKNYITINDYRIWFSFLQNKHVEDMNSYSIALENEKSRTSIFYSGDMYSIGIDFRIILKGYDKIYHECSYYDKCSDVHMNVDKLYCIAKNYKDKVYCMHFDCDKCIERCKELGMNVVEVE